jgi:Family of unknown function (DUF6788)
MDIAWLTRSLTRLRFTRLGSPAIRGPSAVPHEVLEMRRSMSVGRRMIRPYRWLTVRKQDREAPQLVRERVKCGKLSCHCARGVRHGPYWYFRYEEWDRTAGIVRYRREYVSKVELSRVQGWIRRERAGNKQMQSFLSLARQYVSRPTG